MNIYDQYGKIDMGLIEEYFEIIPDDYNILNYIVNHYTECDHIYQGTVATLKSLEDSELVIDIINEIVGSIVGKFSPGVELLCKYLHRILTNDYHHSYNIRMDKLSNKTDILTLELEKQIYGNRIITVEFLCDLLILCLQNKAYNCFAFLFRKFIEKCNSFRGFYHSGMFRLLLKNMGSHIDNDDVARSMANILNNDQFTPYILNTTIWENNHGEIDYIVAQDVRVAWILNDFAKDEVKAIIDTHIFIIDRYSSREFNIMEMINIIKICFDMCDDQAIAYHKQVLNEARL